MTVYRTLKSESHTLSQKSPLESEGSMQDFRSLSYCYDGDTSKPMNLAIQDGSINSKKEKPKFAIVSLDFGFLWYASDYQIQLGT